jgi:hypothetical protein
MARYTNTKDIIDKVASIAENAELIEVEMTPEHVAYMADCSVLFASRMLQYWEGAGKPIYS